MFRPGIADASPGVLRRQHVNPLIEGFMILAVRLTKHCTESLVHGYFLRKRAENPGTKGVVTLLYPLLVIARDHLPEK
jgi:hypothetical protein